MVVSLTFVENRVKTQFCDAVAVIIIASLNS